MHNYSDTRTFHCKVIKGAKNSSLKTRILSIIKISSTLNTNVHEFVFCVYRNVVKIIKLPILNL